jgi:hypothetical protein
MMELSGLRSGTGSVQILADPDPEGPKTYESYGSGPNNTDYEHENPVARSRTLLARSP